MRARGAVDQIRKDGLGVRVRCVRGDGVEHGIAERPDLLFLVGVLDYPSGSHHGINETVVIRQGLKSRSSTC